MNNLIKIIVLLTLCVTTQNVKAVQLSDNGLGQVLIYPYYTVNNNLDTLYSIVNTTADPKALKIRFLEGDIGKEVLIFNVYLSAYDVWTGALVSTQSTIAGHVGEPSALHVSFDESCAPFLNKAGQEFLPFVIDEDSNPSNHNLSRAREGYFEVIEMGVLTGNAEVAADHGSTGVPASCTALENAWSNSSGWNLGALTNPTGGLMGSASIINVGEGIAFPYDAIAIDNFWDGAGLHTAPGAATPNLNSGATESRVLLANGDLAISEWQTGFEAVSAVLMKERIYNEYAYDLGIAGKSEWVVTFPTKSYHVDHDGAAIKPFIATWNGLKSCDDFIVFPWDREEQYYYYGGGAVGTRPPDTPLPRFCYASNVLEFVHPTVTIHPATSRILGSNNKETIPGATLQHATENGWARIDFSAEYSYRMTPVSGTGYIGLPATGFMVQQFTNAGAAEGLLAQYGNLYAHKGIVLTTE